MQDPRIRDREQTIARLLAKGVTAEEIAQIAADEAAFEAMRLARAQERRNAPAPTRPKAAAAASPPPAAPPPPVPAPAPSAAASRAAPAPAQPEPKKARYRIRNWKAYNQSPPPAWQPDDLVR